MYNAGADFLKMPKPVRYPDKEEGAESVPIPAELHDVAVYLREEIDTANKTTNPDEATRRRWQELRRRLEEDADVSEKTKDTLREQEVDNISRAARRLKKGRAMQNALRRGSYEEVLTFLNEDFEQWEKLARVDLGELEGPFDNVQEMYGRAKNVRDRLAAYISKGKK